METLDINAPPYPWHEPEQSLRVQFMVKIAVYNV